MITPELVAVSKWEPDWNVIIPVTVAVCVSGGAIIGFIVKIWDRLKICFADKVEVELLKTELHEIRVRVATLEKYDGKLDEILALIRQKRRGHD